MSKFGHVIIEDTGGDAADVVDGALQVALHQHTISGTLGALDAVLELNPDSSMAAVVFQISGTWKGKIVVEGTIDSTWVGLSIVQPGGTITFNGVNNDNQNGVYRVLMAAGYSEVRLRMSSYTSGTASAIINGASTAATAFAWQLTAANLQMTANQATGTNLHTVVDSGSVAVTGTVSVSQSNPTNLQATVTPAAGSKFSTIIDSGSVGIVTTELTASAPTNVYVGTVSVIAVTANPGRRGLILVNTSVNIISLGLGSAAVLNSGITLLPNGVLNMEYADRFTGYIYAIASAAGSNLAVQEFT